MVKTGIYWQNPEYLFKPGRDFIFDPSLVLELPLYKLDGASFADRSAYGHLCTNTGAIWTPGGRDFDGVDDYAKVPHHDSITFTTQDFSIVYWVKLDAIGDRVHLCKGSWQADGWYLQEQPDNTMKFELDKSGQQSAQYSVTGMLETERFMHLAFIRNGSSAKIFKNAEDKTGSPVSVLAPDYSARDLAIGCYDNINLFINGIIGEVQIYNRALTLQEVQRNYLATKWRYQ